jgi:hypothetical protein
LGIARNFRAWFRAPAAGAPPTGSPPQMGTSGSQRRGFRRTRAGAGGCGVGNHHVPAKCARGYPRKRPGSTPNPKSGSEIAIDTRRRPEIAKWLPNCQCGCCDQIAIAELIFYKKMKQQ